MRYVIAVLIVLLAGCMGSMGYQNMSADQIKALGKESNIACTDATSVWGKVRTVFINVDKSVVEKGGIEVADGCGVKFLNERPAPAIASPKLPSLPPLQWGPAN